MKTIRMKHLLDDGFIGVRLGPSIAVPDLDFNAGKALITEITLKFEEPFRRYFQIPFPYPKSVFARLGTCKRHFLFP
jgi:hypothetical protein